MTHFQEDPLTHLPLIAVFRLWDLTESGIISQRELSFVMKKGRADAQQQAQLAVFRTIAASWIVLYLLVLYECFASDIYNYV